MHCQASQYRASHRPGPNQLPVDESIGELFRQHGEEFIQHYKPNIKQIKLIRSIRVCRTPALGAKQITCKNCGDFKYIYKSCGNSHCMICQSIKREQWVDKLKNKLLAVPYTHTVFTLPHQLNGLARKNQNEIYSLLLKVSWLTIKQICANPDHLGATPGMISVLHTFGSDMKYHIHVHSLVTFGGLNNQGNWIYPKDKHKLCRYRQICSLYKKIFLYELKQLYLNGKIKYHLNFEEIENELIKIRWVVHQTRPTMDTSIIENYLARYINRIAISPNRIQYIKESQQVNVLYNDYKNQQTGQAAPKEIKILQPLIAIGQILQHVLPSYFQKSRSYGLHNGSSKLKNSIQDLLKRNGRTVRTILEIITDLLKTNIISCEICGSNQFLINQINPDKLYLQFILVNNKNKSPPTI